MRLPSSIDVRRFVARVRALTLVGLGLCSAGCDMTGGRVESSDDGPTILPGPPRRDAGVGPSLLAEAPACPSDMAVVAGSYCPAVQQRCVAWQPGTGIAPGTKRPPRMSSTDEDTRGAGLSRENTQCRLFASPTACLSPRREPMRFCMDTFEWPNERGALPRVLVSWQDARALCESKGKRLCTEEEWNLACEGDEMLPYVYGYERDASRCNFDRPYRPRTFKFLPWDACMGDGPCKTAFEAIDQRVPAGSMEGCRSSAGVHDLNGNANEWVMLPREKGPHRSGLKGGWWGPVRDRCRPTVKFHDEGDFGYEVGFRCCSDARG